MDDLEIECKMEYMENIKIQAQKKDDVNSVIQKDLRKTR